MSIELDKSWNHHLSNHPKENVQTEVDDIKKADTYSACHHSNENSQICPTLPPLPDLIPLRIKKKREKDGEEEEADQMDKDNYGVECNNKSNSSQITIKIKKKSLNFNLDESSISTIISQHSNQETNISTDSIIMTPSTEDNLEETSRTSSPSQLSNCGNRSIIKTEPACLKNGEPLMQPEPIVTLRKSDRKKVARDIFFLFEEMPISRKRNSSGGKPNNKVIKSKFGHLSAAVDVKPNIRQLKSSLKQYKTKTTIPQQKVIDNHPKPQSIKIKPLPPKISSISNEPSSPVPRVNPIFLFVKQDDTRIVEVRCEDYDKRNRIKLTKTDKGWRSVPRTDPSSSRVFKMFDESQESDKWNDGDSIYGNETDYNSSNDFVSKCHKKKKKKKKKKSRIKSKEAGRKNVGIDNLAQEHIAISSENNHKVYEKTNHERDEIFRSVVDEGVSTDENIVLDSLSVTVEPNNKSTDDLNKDLTQISDDIDLDISLDNLVVGNRDEHSQLVQLCPQTGLFINANGDIISSPSEMHQLDHNGILHTGHLSTDIVQIQDNFDPTEMDTKNLKELLEDADLLQHCTDNAFSGAELIDSLMKRGCEDVNHISNEDHINSSTSCLNDFDNEDDELLLQQQPVEDIITRLGESLTTSPKCLSFNESGDIEGMHGELYQRPTQADVFNTALEELSITIKNIEQSKDIFEVTSKKSMSTENTAIASPDSCADELPKDLTCKKTLGQDGIGKERERPHSRSSDAIQSPQPSGLPPVPPSPDIISTKTKFLEQLLHSSISTKSPQSSLKKISSLPQQQKEPLDLGKHRKSASPTVSCSQDGENEPSSKRLKRDSLDQPIKDPDPLTQLKLLIQNSQWKVPDPILVPKDRLSAVLASPAREIPLLLTTRPELRLPEAFAFPSILHDPEILVISISQLENILEKQIDTINKPKKKSPLIPQVTIEPVTNDIQKNRGESQKQIEEDCKRVHEIIHNNKNVSNSHNTSALNMGSDIDAATLAAFNQMFWLPYLNQMTPDILKSMNAIHGNINFSEILPLFLQQQKQQKHIAVAVAATALSNPISFQNPIEFAMWQEALNQAHMPRSMGDLNKPNSTQIQNKKTTENNKMHANIRNSFGMTPISMKSNQLPNQEYGNLHTHLNQQIQQCTPNEKPTNQNQSTSRKVLNPFYRPPEPEDGDCNSNKQIRPPESKPRVTCKSLTNLLQPDRLSNDTNTFSNLMTIPSLKATINNNSPKSFLWPKSATNPTSSGQQLQNSSLQSHLNISNHNNSKINNQNSHNQNQGKLKVKSGTHLLDPATLQRRLMSNEDMLTEVGSTTNSLDDAMITDPNGALWHPLFGNSQKNTYTSPWQWTTVTATGE
ncbi:hypothetical protein ACFFRR_009717 [Megaselia abdita]